MLPSLEEGEKHETGGHFSKMSEGQRSEGGWIGCPRSQALLMCQENKKKQSNRNQKKTIVSVKMLG